MSDKRRMGLIRLAVVLLVIGALAIIAIGNAVCSPDREPSQNTSKALVAKLVKGPTEIVIPNLGENISAYWAESGALEQGFSLTVYKKAIKKLNPGKNVNVFRDSEAWKVPWPKGQD